MFNGKVIIGHGGAEMKPTRGYVTAYDAESGKQIWRFFIVPGDPSKGFEDKAMEMAAKTWTGKWWKFGGGGTVWNAMAYDPEFYRVYLGTGNGGPWNQRIRSPEGGDNLFLTSIVALDADTGQYAWHYQTTPGETWDFNDCMDIELATLTIDGKPRKALLHAPKNGFFYVIDRETGKLISAEKFSKVTWADGIDMKTGRPIENPKARYANEPFLMYPGPAGGHNLQAMSFNPNTGLTYIPARNSAWKYADTGIDAKTWAPRPGMVLNTGTVWVPGTVLPPEESFLLAWDPVAQKKVWSVPTPGSTGGGTLTTAGDLVFQGQMDGAFRAYDARNGKMLWTFDAQVGVLSHPISYVVDKTQYITVIAGLGGAPAASTGAAFGWDYYTQPRRVLTFALDGRVKLPPPSNKRPELVDDPDFKVDPKLVEKGSKVYADRCATCHGPGVQAGGAAPELRASSMPLDKQAFTSLLHDGPLQGAGMPRFPDLTEADVTGLMHYIRSVQREKPKAPPQALHQ